MKKKYKHSLTHTSKTIKNQVALYKKRLNTVNLIWCNQVIDFIQNSKIKSIKDIGCNYFQFYKELKLRKIKTKYFGYDIDDNFIKLGLIKFPELKKKYKIGNCENIKLLKTDFSIMSAVLEHVENPIKLLNNVISSTRKIICIRTYLGVKSYKAVAHNFKNQILPYNCNQFSFKDVEYKLKKNGFKVFFILDKAANYSQFRLIDNKHKRFMYIVIGIKN
jgi:SAM-dependent methyltransferase